MASKKTPKKPARKLVCPFDGMDPKTISLTVSQAQFVDAWVAFLVDVWKIFFEENPNPDVDTMAIVNMASNKRYLVSRRSSLEEQTLLLLEMTPGFRSCYRFQFQDDGYNEPGSFIASSRPIVFAKLHDAISPFFDELKKKFVETRVLRMLAYCRKQVDLDDMTEDEFSKWILDTKKNGEAWFATIYDYNWKQPFDAEVAEIASYYAKALCSTRIDRKHIEEMSKSFEGLFEFVTYVVLVTHPLRVMWAFDDEVGYARSLRINLFRTMFFVNEHIVPTNDSMQKLYANSQFVVDDIDDNLDDVDPPELIPSLEIAVDIMRKMRSILIHAGETRWAELLPDVTEIL